MTRQFRRFVRHMSVAVCAVLTFSVATVVDVPTADPIGLVVTFSIP